MGQKGRSRNHDRPAKSTSTRYNIDNVAKSTLRKSKAKVGKAAMKERLSQMTVDLDKETSMVYNINVRTHH